MPAPPTGYRRAARLLPLLVIAGLAPARADGPPPGPGGLRPHPLPPEIRYRDPRPLPRAWRRGPPPVLVEAYLPRYTERPMYNEPPERFPRR